MSSVPVDIVGVDPDRWKRHGACWSLGPHLFFPVDGENRFQIHEREAKAKKYCDICVVRQTCLEVGMNEYGIWGGMNSQERDGYRGIKPRKNRK